MKQLTPYNIPGRNEYITSQEALDLTSAKLLTGNNRLTNQGLSTRNVSVEKETLVLSPTEASSMQRAINILNNRGGGIIQLRPGTYNMTDNIVLYSSIYFYGVNTLTTIIDFGGANKSILIQGTGAYTTGTVSISNSGQTVTGSGTSWLTNATVGQKILLSGVWYTIYAVSSDTSLIVTAPYAGNTLAGATYTIATTKDDIRLETFTVQNSAGPGVYLQYSGVHTYLRNFATQLNVTGIIYDTTSQSECKGVQILANQTGVSLTNTHFASFETNAFIDTTVGHSIVTNNVSNLEFRGSFIANGAGDGINMTDSVDVAFSACSVKQNAGQGIEFVSGNDNITFAQGALENNGSDGAKFTATSDNCFITTSSISNNGGYGVNIAAASCDNTIIGMNNFSGNTTAALNDAGTGTVISANVGI